MQTNQQHKKRGFIQTRIMYLQVMNPTSYYRERERERDEIMTQKSMCQYYYLFMN